MKLQEHNTLAKFFKTVSEFSSQQKSIEEFAAYVIRHFDLLEDPRQSDGSVHIPASLVPDLGNQAAQAHFKKIMSTKNSPGITKAYQPPPSFINLDKVVEILEKSDAEQESDQTISPKIPVSVNLNAPRKIVAQPKASLEQAKNVARKIDEDFLKDLSGILRASEGEKTELDSALIDSIKITTERLEKVLDPEPVADIVGETIQHAVVLDAEKTAAEHVSELEHRAEEKLSTEFVATLDDLLTHPEKIETPKTKAERVRDINFKTKKSGTRPQPAKKTVKVKVVKPAVKKTVAKKAKKTARK